MKTTRYFVSAVLFVMFHFITFCQTTGSENITFEREGILLTGRLHLAPGTGKFPTVVLLSGFPGGRTDVISIGKLLAGAGINVLTFQYCGTYDSQGLTSFENHWKDIQAAIDFIRQTDNINRFQIDTRLIYLGGYSHGGGMALTYSVYHPEITSVFSIAGNFDELYRQYVSNEEVRTGIDNMFEELIAKGVIRVEPGALPKEMTGKWIERLDTITDINKNARVLAQKDILLVCGWDDRVQPLEQFMLPLYRTLKKENAKNLQMVAFQDGHNFIKSRKILATHIADWILSAPGRKQ